jgi:hypothetical protein
MAGQSAFVYRYARHFRPHDRMDDLRKGDAWLVALQLLVRAATNRPLAVVIQQRYARFRRKLTTLIERGQSEGVVRGDIPADLLADQVSAMATPGR